MNPQQAYRLYHAVKAHDVAFLDALDQFASTAYVSSYTYIHADERYLYIGVDAYDVRAVKLDRATVRRLHDHIKTVGVSAFRARCLDIASSELLKVNDPFSVVSRPFKGRSSQLHTSHKTRKAQAATNAGRRRDARKADAYKASCSSHYFMPIGKM